MEKEIDNIEGEDFNIEELLSEDEDSPVEEVTEETTVEPERKSRGRPKGTTKKVEVSDEIPAEIASAAKDLEGMEWKPFSQVAFEGYQNNKTGEVIDEKESIRRCLCYAQEVAIN